MNSLILTLRGEDRAVVLPVSYQYMLQGLIYSAWLESFPELHDSGCTGNGSGIHLFTFSPLEGHYDIRGSLIRFDPLLRFELRSPCHDLVEAAADHFAASGSVRLGTNVLRVENAETRDRMMFPGRARIRTRGMVTVHETLPDRSTRYFSPEEDGWDSRLRNILLQKLRMLGLPDDDRLEIEPVRRTLRKRVTNFKGTFITGWAGEFQLKTDPVCMAVLYYSGLGSRNSQGCGMFDIL